MAVKVEQLITDHLDLWTHAQTAKSTSGRGSNNKIELTGIKKLRELILELAVRGKLVQQDPNDEPAIELLKRIAAEKEALVKTGKLKKQKPLSPITDEEKPCELPQGWQWCRLDNLVSKMDSGWSPSCPPESSPNESIWGVLKTTAVQPLEYRENENKVLDDSKEPRPELEIQAGDILITRAGPKNRVGISCLVEKTRSKLMISDKIIRFHLVGVECVERFIVLCLNAGATAAYLERSKSGMADSQLNISQDKLRFAPIPICSPVLQEQIMDRVDELMALCDQLEQQSYQQLDAHNQLVDALLATLTQSLNADDLASNWQRLAAHFDTLFTTEYSIDALKQTILQLAVMGKLVKQDPSDEPASELLKRIAFEKDALVKAGKIKKQKPLPPISEDEKPFELPRGWVWVHLLDISEEIGTGPFGSMIHKSDYISGGIPLINPSHMINDKIVEDKDISVNQAKLSELASYKLLSGDIVLARRGEVGRMAIVGERESGWLCGTGSFYLRLNKEISREFMALVFRVKSTREYLTGNAVGTTMVNLNHGILNSLPIGLPSPTVQNKIVHRVYELMMLCDALACKLNSVREIQAIFAAALVQQVMA